MEAFQGIAVQMAGFDWQSFLPALMMFLASYFGSKQGAKNGSGQ